MDSGGRGYNTGSKEAFVGRVLQVCLGCGQGKQGDHRCQWDGDWSNVGAEGRRGRMGASGFLVLEAGSR